MKIHAQTIEKLEAVLTPPIYINNAGGMLAFEARGNVYPKGHVFECGENSGDGRIGTYRMTVLYGTASEYQGTMLIRLSDGRDLLWHFYYKIDPDEIGQPDFGWPYEGIILHTDKTILTDYTPLSRKCFGGKLVVYFLNGG